MQIHLGSKHIVADVAVALDVTGREHLVIVAKATWSIPAPGQRPKPMTPQPLVMTDQYHGEPGESAMRYGSDMARFKPRCDVLFDAVAYSPDAEPVRELIVHAQVGTMKKSVRVLGNRQWSRAMGICKLSDPQPFTEMPLHHGLAFGGTRWYEKGRGAEAERLCDAHLANPVGLGFAGQHTLDQIHGQAAPNLEDPLAAIGAPSSQQAPWAFSAIGRHWSPRRDFAGTYDQVWQRDVFPLLPADFDERFHQCASVDQQVVFPSGAEPVRLLNMVKGQPDLKFNLPRMPMQVSVLRKDYSSAAPIAVVDTLFFETEKSRFSAVWRASLPLKRRLQEIDSVAIGPVNPAWWQAKLAGRDGDCIGCEPSASSAMEADV
jgi:hypothetical protein